MRGPVSGIRYPVSGSDADGRSRFHLALAAAGLGTRLGGEPKTWREVEGRPVLAWVIDRLLVLEPISVVVAVEASRLDQPRPAWLPATVRLVAGGVDRAASVLAALQALDAAPDDLVAVHDAARPAVDLGDFRRVVAAAAVSGAAVLGRAVTDTLKRVEGGRIVETIDRRNLGRAETPQVARLEYLLAALGREEVSGIPPTDESSALEALGIPVTWVEAHHPNPKLTVAADLPLLEALLRAHQDQVREKIDG